MHTWLRAIAVVSSAVALSACSPSLENDSDKKIDTAVEVTATAVAKPGYIDCFGTPTVQPSRLSLDCIHDVSRLEDITWESWDEEGARGSGTLHSPFDEPRQVSVVLESPVGESFTDLYVDEELAYP
ncbi:hypothetical protein [Corynebacterium sp. H130]|uniref:hypothetical protein n=1 Tax=Corynebacterium sp. H130 TaxID=3133444 RepID=UPI0030A2AE8E